MELHTLDLNFLDTPQVIAAYVLVGPNSVALIETGPGSTLNTLLAGLRGLGIRPNDVREVLVTHIHLDHAGAAGWWARQGAAVYVHPFGAPHLIDPGKLLASAHRIYGDQMDYLWGEFLAAPADKVQVVKDGEQIAVAGATAQVIETPGHARHHHAYKVDDIAFTGDAAGVRLPGYAALAMPSPPPEFDLEAWLETINKLSALNLAKIYPTHYGEVSDPAEHFRRFAPLVREATALVGECAREQLNREQTIERYAAWHLSRPEVAQLDEVTRGRYDKVNSAPMSVDGLLRYWQKR
jgi:glyoxylase-like metal-dependent hydrolase (beta-lactamase superfamily II)